MEVYKELGNKSSKSDLMTFALNSLQSLGYTIHGDPLVIRDVPWSSVYCFKVSKDGAKEKFFLKRMDPAFANEPNLLKLLSKICSNKTTKVIRLLA